MLSIEALATLAHKHRSALSCKVSEFSLGNKTFAFNTRPAIMGVINLSPDSWYRESVCASVEAAVRRGRVLMAQGADIIDIGAESTLAHADIVGSAAQSSRLLPVVRALSSEGACVSVETYHLEVAKLCMEAGARVINLTGTSRISEMARLAADFDAALILCYVQGENVRQVGDLTLGADPVSTMLEFFSRACDEASNTAGQPKLFIDAGLGFYYGNLKDSATRVGHQMRVFLNTFRFRSLGWPVCNALPHAFEYFGEEVRSAEAFFAVLGALGKTDLFRTHEVPRVKAVLDTMAAY